MSALTWLRNPWRHHVDVGCLVEKARASDYGVEFLLKTFVSAGNKSAKWVETEGTSPRWLAIRIPPDAFKLIADAVAEWKGDAHAEARKAAEDAQYGPDAARDLRAEISKLEAEVERLGRELAEEKEAKATAEEQLADVTENENEEISELREVLSDVIDEWAAGRDPRRSAVVQAGLVRTMELHIDGEFAGLTTTLLAKGTP